MSNASDVEVRCQIGIRVDRKMRAAMLREAKKLNLTLNAYLIHCHNMWVRMEDGRVK